MKIFTAVILLLTTITCLAGEYEEYMDETFALINMGENEEALERFIWFHNNGVTHGLTSDPSRLSFGLMYWVDFGEKHPPALAALKSIRDINTNNILKGNNTCDLFSEVEAINRHLSEDTKTIELFKRLDKEQPLLAKQCWVYFKDLAIESGNKYFIGKYINDFKGEYDTAERHFMMSMRFLSAEADNVELIDITKESYMADVEKILRLANQSSDIDATNYIKKKYDVISKQYSLH